MTQRLPFWAVKPKHKKTVIVTPKGWAVEETGELLVRVRDLDQKLAEYGIQVDFDEVELTDEVVETPEEVKEVAEEKKEEVVAPVKKKAGRPKKVKA
jgi:hypothetical protein